MHVLALFRSRNSSIIDPIRTPCHQSRYFVSCPNDRAACLTPLITPALQQNLHNPLSDHPSSPCRWLPQFGASTATTANTAKSRRIHQRPRADEPIIELTPFLEAAAKRQRHLHSVCDARVATLAFLGTGPTADHVLALHAAGSALVAARGGRLQVVDRVAAPVHEGEADAVVGLVRDGGLVVVVGGSGELGLDWRRCAVDVGSVIVAVLGEVVIVGVGHIQPWRGRVRR